MRPHNLPLAAFIAVFAPLAVTGCTTHVEVWPPETHPASPHTHSSPPVAPPPALAHADAVAPAREGVRIPSGGGEHYHHAPPADPKAAYACPMHPEVTSDSPGECPKCGMDLQPRRQPEDKPHGSAQ
jgi:hypothetical protein